VRAAAERIFSLQAVASSRASTLGNEAVGPNYENPIHHESVSN